MARKKIKEEIEAKVEQIVEEVKAEATEDVAICTIYKWHVAAAAVLATALILVFVL